MYIVTVSSWVLCQRVVSVWNSLPASIVNVSTFDASKRSPQPVNLSIFLPSFQPVDCDCVRIVSYIHRVPKKLVPQAHIDNSVNSQRIFKILSLTQSAENLL